MLRGFFVPSVMALDQLMGNLFFRGASISEIESMPYHRMKYWAGWCEQMRKAEKAVIDNKPKIE